MARIDAQAHGHINGFVELGIGGGQRRFHPFSKIIAGAGLDPALGF